LGDVAALIPAAIPPLPVAAVSETVPHKYPFGHANGRDTVRVYTPAQSIEVPPWTMSPFGSFDHPWEASDAANCEIFTTCVPVVPFGAEMAPVNVAPDNRATPTPDAVFPS